MNHMDHEFDHHDHHEEDWIDDPCKYAIIFFSLLGQLFSHCVDDNGILTFYPRSKINHTRFFIFQRDFWLRRPIFLISYLEFQRFLRSELPLDFIQLAYGDILKILPPYSWYLFFSRFRGSGPLRLYVSDGRLGR